MLALLKFNANYISQLECKRTQELDLVAIDKVAQFFEISIDIESEGECEDHDEEVGFASVLKSLQPQTPVGK